MKANKRAASRLHNIIVESMRRVLGEDDSFNKHGFNVNMGNEISNIITSLNRLKKSGELQKDNNAQLAVDECISALRNFAYKEYFQDMKIDFASRNSDCDAPANIRHTVDYGSNINHHW